MRISKAALNVVVGTTEEDFGMVLRGTTRKMIWTRMNRRSIEPRPSHTCHLERLDLMEHNVISFTYNDREEILRQLN